MRNRFYIILFALLFIFLLCACSPKSVGVIGGADGPTSIFVAGEVGGSAEENAGAPSEDVNP